MRRKTLAPVQENLFGNTSWSSYQEAIFREVELGQGNIGVIARAGAGKTTLIEEITRRLPANTKVLVLAFNTDIATELSKRVRKGCDVMTLNGLGHRAIVQSFGNKKPTSNSLARSILRGESFFPHPSQTTRRNEFLKIIGRYKNTMNSNTQSLLNALSINPLFFLEESDRMIGTEEEQVKEALRQISVLVNRALSITKKEIENSTEIDYDDQLWAPVSMKLPTEQWDFVLGDEVQDWNAAQVELVSQALRPGGRIVIVGDPKQSIYTFRGADPKAFDRLNDKFNSKIFRLPVTYRCAKKIVEVAQKLVPDLEAGDSNPLGEVSSVDTLDMEQLIPGDFVISRKNAPLLGLCLQAISAGIPARIAGKDLGRDLLEIVNDAKSVTNDDASVFLHIQKELSKKIEFSKTLEDDTVQNDLVDKLECMRILFEKHSSSKGVEEALQLLCIDQKKSGGVVLFTTAHRAKGLEADRVWLLETTFRSDKPEEQNLLYVAQTRAKRTLFLIGGP